MLVTGNGNVGKSSLVDALRHGKCTVSHSSTHAIRIETLPLHGPKPVIAQAFDFGGQEIYMGTHALFLRGRAVQLIVFDAETENQRTVSDRITGETIRNQPLRHWVETIRQQSPNSQFVLVQNKMECPEKLNLATVSFLDTCENEGMSVAKVSATVGRYVPALHGHLCEAAYALPEYGLQMPLSWHNVRQYFIDNLAITTTNRQKLIDKSAFDRLCAEHDVLPGSEPALLRYLHRTGTVYYDKEYLADTIIADQEWAIKAIYTALDRSGDLYERLRNQSYGKCQVRDLFSSFGENYTPPQRWLLLNFMESCGLCFPVKEQDYDPANEQTYYIFPEFLPTETPSAVSDFIRQNVHRTFLQTLDFLSYAHVQQLIARWGLKTAIWNIGRTGLYVLTPEGRFALTADLEKHTLMLHVDCLIPPAWRADLLRQFAYDNNQWDEITAPSIHQPVTIQPNSDHSVDALGGTPEVVQSKVKKLVASYASQDEEFLHVLRKKLAARSHAVEFFYDRKLSSRNAWDEQLEHHFQTADGFVFFLSDDYIDADNKWYISEKEWPIMRARFDVAQSNGGLPIIGIKVVPASTAGIPLLETYSLFEKGAQMPKPATDKDGASQFMQRFVDKWVLGEFAKGN